MNTSEQGLSKPPLDSMNRGEVIKEVLDRTTTVERARPTIERLVLQDLTDGELKGYLQYLRRKPPETEAERKQRLDEMVPKK